VRTIEAPDGRIWVGTNGNGIDVFDRDWLQVDAFRPDPSDPAALADGAITCFARGPSDQIWVATLDGTLHRHESEGHFSRLGQREGLAGGQIRALSFARDGALWAGSSQGLTRVGFDERGRVADIKTFRHNVDDDNSLSGVAVEALAWAADGRLWVGTDQGLNLLDPTTARIRRFLRRAHDPAGLPNNWIPDLLMARDGRLWIATAGGVALLESLEEDGARFSTLASLTGTDPLPADSLIEDGEGAIWIGPHRRVDPRNWQISEFGPADGKTLRSFFIASRTRLSDGRLLFGSHEGLLAVDPATLRPWNFEPNLVATGLRIGSRKHPAGLNRLQLQPGDKSFSLDFAALDFSAPERNRYRHRLHGFENLWQETSASQRTLTYTNLEPGTYRLEVSGSNRAGLFSSHRLEIALEVLPAFTQTLLFKLLLAVLVSLLCYLGYRLTLRQLKHRSEVLERLVRERTLALEESNRQLEAAHRRTEEASLSDSLTGIRNRRFLENSIRVDTDLVERRWRESAPGLESDLIFLLLDLDHFKSVNDSWGHRAGDAVLIQSADLLKRQLRSSDFLVRWGGEEFLIVARFVDRATAPKLAEKLRRAIAEHAFTLPDGGVIERTVSIGFAAYPFLQDQPSTYDWEKTVHLADLALYRAKNDGRNRALGLAAGPNLLPGSDLTNLASALAAGAVALV
jgi:diguanylate cyclase (GGDEF)-like protein